MYKYNQAGGVFDWSCLGDVDVGRKNLGSDMPVIVYRLMQFTLKNVMNNTIGAEKSSEIFRAAGAMAGREFYRHLLAADGLDFNAFVSNLQEALKTYKIGLLKLEKADLATLTLTLTVGEDVDCSGLSVTDESVCEYDEGFIAGILEAYTGKTFTVREIDCWATGDRVCRFNAHPS